MATKKQTGIEKFSPTRAKLGEIKRDYSAPMVVTDGKTKKGALSSRKVIKDAIADVKTIHKSLKAPLLELSRKIDNEKTELLSELEPLRDNITEKIKEYEEIQAEKLKNRREQEAKRIQGLRDTIMVFKSKYELKTGLSLEELEARETELRGLVLQKKDYQEFFPSVQMDRDLMITAVEERIVVVKKAMCNRYHELTNAIWLDQDYDILATELKVLEEKEKKRIAQEKLDQAKADKAIQDRIDEIDKKEKAEKASQVPPKEVPVKEPEKKLKSSSIPAVDKARIALHLKLAEKSIKLTGGPLESGEGQDLIDSFTLKLKELIREFKEKLK